LQAMLSLEVVDLGSGGDLVIYERYITN
jgi:hypothetical protein